MESFPEDKLAPSATALVLKASGIAIQRNHRYVTSDHLLLAYIKTEDNVISQLMKVIGVRCDTFLEVVENNLKIKSLEGFSQPVPDQISILIMNMAFILAQRQGRSFVESGDVFLAIFETDSHDTLHFMRQIGCSWRDFKMAAAKIVNDMEIRHQGALRRLALPGRLNNYGFSLNLRVYENKVSSAIGRENEIRRLMEILCHRERPSSAILIGEPGVGKTAIVEGLARIIELEPQNVPIRLQNSNIVSLAMNSMVAGTSLRGMFEENIQMVIREIALRPEIILFIDEIHTIIGAGAAMGAPSDAAQILKSVISKGEIRIIGATTLGEYRQFISEDEALARRFRLVNVRESTVDEARAILLGMRNKFLKNYGVNISDEAIEAALEMSSRYMRHLRLPDKVVGWLDTAAVKAEIARVPEVNRKTVLNVVAEDANLPEDMITRDVLVRFNGIEEKLASRVVGQKKAIKTVADRLKLNRGLLKDNFDRPDGVFLFLGPTGVGKTELAKALANHLFGDDKKMIRIDMSEYNSGLTGVEKLIGQPRGVVDSSRGGILTESIRSNPYTVLLLDEIEKASLDVLNLFLQAFDEGWVTDGRGRRVYLSDALIIMTSNIGSQHFRRLTNPLGFRTGEANISQIEGLLTRELERRFSPEFINRIDSVAVFDPLTREEAVEIAYREVEKIRLAMYKSGKSLDLEKAVFDVIAQEGFSLAYGARFLKRYIEEVIKIPISCQASNTVFKARVLDGKIVVTSESIPTVLPKSSKTETVESGK